MTAEVRTSFLHGIVTVLLVPSPSSILVRLCTTSIHYLGQNAPVLDPKELFKGSLKEQKQSLTDPVAKHRQLQIKQTGSFLCC